MHISTVHPAHRPSFHVLLLVLATASLALISLTGCGGTDSVVHVEGTPISISKPTLNHWMKAVAGGDFRATVGTKGPVGLVSEPANYPRCEAAVRTVAPRTFTGKAKLSSAQISTRCHQLYQAFKEQALNLLISIEWTVAEAAEKGIHVSNAEVKREFVQFRKRPYPTEAELKKFLSERRWTLSDVLYQLKRNILVRRILPIFKAKVDRVGTDLKTYAKFVLQRFRRLIARTSCTPGYVVSNCKEYHEPKRIGPGPGDLLTDIVER